MQNTKGVEHQGAENAVRVVVTSAGDIYGEDTPGARQLARRIRACVNACQGIPTEELEKGVIQDMRRLIELVAPLLPPEPASQDV